jgi:murein DD-endopeptidase MepM/ murein hydrolase activator NlpD
MVKRASKAPVAQKSPTARKRRGARIFTLVAMLFIAGIALATSIPAAALLTPEQVAMQNEQARMKYAAFVGDGQSIGGDGGAQAAAGRDGVALGGSTAQPMVGAYSDKRLKVTVPVSNNPIKWPFPSAVHISDTFGWRYLFGSSNFHTGLDFDLPYGTDIRAVADGIVTLVEDPGPMCGASVTIEHNVGGNKFTSVYCHMITHSTSLKAGDTVSVGDKVGQIGLTGITTGAHLHLEIRLSDIPVDPYAFLKQAAGNPPA